MTCAVANNHSAAPAVGAGRGVWGAQSGTARDGVEGIVFPTLFFVSPAFHRLGFFSARFLRGMIISVARGLGCSVPRAFLFEVCMDIADKAQADMERSDSLAQQHRRRVAPVGSESADVCAECGLEIPSARQVAIPGTQHCAECAGLIEEGLI